MAVWPTFFHSNLSYLTMHDLSALLSELEKIEHGFKHIIVAGDQLLADHSIDPYELGIELLGTESYQGRMLGVHILGRIAASDERARVVLKERVSRDPN